MKQMQIIYKRLTDINPYKNNPRKNDEAVDDVAESIKNFGWKVPVIIDAAGEIVAGHTRYKAAKKLGIKEIPCIIADDLTEEQVKAFRLAENKVSEKAQWSPELLDIELESITNIDMTAFGFEMPEELEPPEDIGKEHHRETTNKHYNLEMFDASRSAGFYEMPVIRKSNFIPSDLIGFNYAMNSKNKNTGIHCFVDDYQFERLWTNPDLYIETIAGYECFLSPDFSLYTDMPMAMKVWNVYRSRMIGQYYQDHGIEVIPTVSWAEPETFSFCFDGIEKGSTVAVSTIGVKKDEYALKIWQYGMDEMIKIVQPANILLYGGMVEYDYKGIPVIEYKNHVTENMQTINTKGQ